jgi:hypothetical protein
VNTRLGVAWALDQPPPKPGTLAKHAHSMYDALLQPHMSVDTRALVCPNRTTADYIQHVRNKQYGKPHKVHTSNTIPCRQYRWFCRVRTLTFPAASYTHHHKPGGTPLCVFGCDTRGDITHYIHECQHTRTLTSLSTQPDDCLQSVSSQHTAH